MAWSAPARDRCSAARGAGGAVLLLFFELCAASVYAQASDVPADAGVPTADAPAPAVEVPSATEVEATEPEPVAAPASSAAMIVAGEAQSAEPAPAPTYSGDIIVAGAAAPASADDGFAPSVRWSGYLDFGFFAPQGDGAGHQQDVGHLIFPDRDGITWVFHGDPLSTAVNSRGEPADTGSEANASRAIALDSVDSRGEPTFLINELNLDLTAGLHPSVWLLGSIDLMPRGRHISDPNGVALGDMVDIDLAFANWTPYDTGSTVIDIQAGKVDSVMGIEYRIQESPDRFGITPSLIFRYLGGHPLGLKARARLFDEAVNVALAITNGSHFVESFPFSDEQDRNAFKTFAGRVGVHHEGDFMIEVGASGLLGAQDGQAESPEPLQWQVVGDLNVVWNDLELRAEYTRGEAPGATEDVACDLAPCLRFQGAYGELSYRLTNWFGLLARADWRDADHRSGDDFAYVVDIARGTFGTRFELDRFAILKAEYVWNQELLGRPSIDNDVFTTSFVMLF